MKTITKTDETIQADVMAELRWEPILQAATIGVSVNVGVATLSGEVDNYLMKLATEQAAKRVEGVKVVVQDVVVNTSLNPLDSDERLAHSIVSSFDWDSAVPQEKIDVKVQDGWITLEGQVDWNYQRLAAERALERLTGVKGVSNLINLKPRVLAQDIRNQIQKAFNRSAILEAQQIKVEANGTKVTLRGNVHSWAERREAEAAAWSAPGVTSVDDHLIVCA
jgi:osmotically-inducible protein OsmY